MATKVTFKIVKDREWDEWVVQYLEDGVINEDKSYHTDDREDAEFTKEAMEAEQHVGQFTRVDQTGDRLNIHVERIKKDRKEIRTNRKAKYYTPPGSYDGLVKEGRRWIRVTELNRINKTDWIRWQGPPSSTMEKALKNPGFFQASLLFPERKITI